MRRFLSIVSIAVVIGLTVITAAQAQTCDPVNGCPASPAPPFQCTTPSNNVAVAAIPQGGVFPVPDTCAGGADCLRWSYSFTQLAGQTVSVSALTVDADINIFKASTGTPPGTTTGMKIYANGSTDSSIGGLGGLAFDFRTIKFSSGQPVIANVWTDTNAGIGTVTALAKVGNSGATSCAIAGPDNIVSSGVGKQPVTTTQLDSFEGCDITIEVDRKGCPVSVVAQPAPGSGVTCTVSQTTFTLTPGSGGGGSNQPFSGGVCGNRFVTGNNTCVWYCPTSFGSCFQVCK